MDSIKGISNNPMSLSNIGKNENGKENSFLETLKAYYHHVDREKKEADLMVQEFAVAYDPEIDFVSDGTYLEVRPTVSHDRRYVILDVFTRRQSVEFSEFEFIVGVVSVQQPEVFQQSISTRVSVPDGGTLLIGGFKQVVEEEYEVGVPVLSKIPILKRLFTSRDKVRESRTLLILIKPKIIIQREAEEDGGIE